jgi:hypothetical protein
MTVRASISSWTRHHSTKFFSPPRRSDLRSRSPSPIAIPCPIPAGGRSLCPEAGRIKTRVVGVISRPTGDGSPAPALPREGTHGQDLQTSARARPPAWSILRARAAVPAYAGHAPETANLRGPRLCPRGGPGVMALPPTGQGHVPLPRAHARSPSLAGDPGPAGNAGDVGAVAQDLYRATCESSARFTGHSGMAGRLSRSCGTGGGRYPRRGTLPSRSPSPIAIPCPIPAGGRSYGGWGRSGRAWTNSGGLVPWGWTASNAPSGPTR